MIRLNLCSSFFAVVMPAAGFDTSVKAASPWFARLARDSPHRIPLHLPAVGFAMG